MEGSISAVTEPVSRKRPRRGSVSTARLTAPRTPRNHLPLIEENGRRKTFEGRIRVRLEGAGLPGVVKTNNGGGMASRRRRLADAPGTHDHQRRVESEEFRQALVEPPGAVVRQTDGILLHKHCRSRIFQAQLMGPATVRSLRLAPHRPETPPRDKTPACASGSALVRAASRSERFVIS